MSTRELATVDSVTLGEEDLTLGEEDHGIQTFLLGMKLSGSGHQGFGGIVLRGHLNGKDSPVVDATDALVRELTEFFGVSTFEEIKGRTCFVLRCFDDWGETIEGLEIDGRRWTLTSFVRRHFGKVQTVLERRTESLHGSIEYHTREIAYANKNLAKIASKYVDWEAS